MGRVARAILVAFLVILAAGLGYMLGLSQPHTLTKNTMIFSTTTLPATTTNIIHYFNFSASIIVYSNGTVNYIYPVNLPSKGNVIITLTSNSTFHVKIYDNNNLIAKYSGKVYHKSFQGEGKLELMFKDLSGMLNISINEEY